MNMVNYTGWLAKLDYYGEEYLELSLSSIDGPFIEELQEKIANKNVTVRYWICDKECTKEEANEQFFKTLTGLVDCEYDVSYTETTGYLWTTEELKVGGHDLFSELSNSVGKFLILEVDVYD